MLPRSRACAAAQARRGARRQAVCRARDVRACGSLNPWRRVGLSDLQTKTFVGTLHLPHARVEQLAVCGITVRLRLSVGGFARSPAASTVQPPRLFLFRTRITTCFAYRVEAGTFFRTRIITWCLLLQVLGELCGAAREQSPDVLRRRLHPPQPPEAGALASHELMSSTLKINATFIS